MVYNRRMTRIHLTDDDITANRQGQFSDKQRQMVHWQRLVWIAGTGGLVGSVVGLTAVLLLKLQQPAFASRGELFVAVPVVLFWLWLLRDMPQRWHQTNLDLKVGHVAVIEGPVQTDIDFGIGLFRPVRYYIHLNGRSYRIPKTLLRSFIAGHTYRIFHAAHSHQFLGAQLLVDELKNDSGAPQKLVEPLTPREQQILQLIALGLTNRQIANQLSLSVNTIKMYTSQLYQKLGVNRRTAAVARARELNLL